MGLVRWKKNYMERRNILVIIWENNLRDHGVGPYDLGVNKYYTK